MRFLSVLSTTLLASLVAAAPTPTSENELDARTLAKRASITDVPTTGYATQNGGTTGGNGGTTTTVSTYAQISAAATDDTARIIVVSGTITQTADQIRVGSNKSIIGKDSNAGFVGFGLLIKNPNVIVRNLKISKVLADNGDAIGLQSSAATNIWIDHVDLSSDMDHDKDYYDGLLDITHAADYVTITNSLLHDHYKASLVGHSDDNGSEDTGHLRVTYANNYFHNLNSRGPSLRFGTGHIFNNYYNVMPDAINIRSGAQALVESNVFVDVDNALFTYDTGYAVTNDNNYGTSSNTLPTGTLTSVPYSYTLLGSGNVVSSVSSTAGANLSF